MKTGRTAKLSDGSPAFIAIVKEKAVKKYYITN